MKLYKDIEKTEEISVIDFGIVPAGEKKSVTAYLLNNTKAKLVNISLYTEHKEISIIVCPKEMNEYETAEVVLEWAPSVTLKQGLKAQLELKYVELWS